MNFNFGHLLKDIFHESCNSDIMNWLRDARRGNLAESIL